MANVNDLTDVEVDVFTGFVIIDEETFDAKIIRGTDVILQDTAIRLRTQIGTEKRQGLDSFGWNILGRLKQKLSVSNIQDIVSAISKLILEDERIDDAEVAVTQDPINDDLTISANLRIGELTVPLTIAI